MGSNVAGADGVFQSTLPVWGATVTKGKIIGTAKISIHAPRMGSDVLQLAYVCGGKISIHAPRMGSDAARGGWWALRTYFNPRSPYGERPGEEGLKLFLCPISIHAPRMGSDPQPRLYSTAERRHFNPRSPYGERPHRGSEPAVRGAISIHAPRMGSDTVTRPPCRPTISFQSTLPVWGATTTISSERHFPSRFQSTLPVWGATDGSGGIHPISGFQSTLPVWGATGKEKPAYSLYVDFNPRSPYGERRRFGCYVCTN
mgnify:CR=1 FL=1